MKYLFQLGRHTDLSRAELGHVFLRLHIRAESTLSQEGLLVTTTQPMSPTYLMSQIGGTIKIAEEVAQLKNPAREIADYLATTTPTTKIQFSLSGKDARHLAVVVKKELVSRGKSVRFIQINNTATIIHNHLIERGADLTVVGDSLFATRAIQPIEELSARDYGRPGRDARSGMLPPKLARIMVNIGLAAHDPHKVTLWDPFCGSGTVLAEALLVQCTHLVGSDIANKAIADTKKNIAWLQEQEKTRPGSSVHIFQFDVTKPLQHTKPKSADVIVTEPYLGNPLTGKETRPQLQKQISELKELYMKAFKTFYTALKPHGSVVFIIPQFLHKKEWLKVDCMAEIQKLGFVSQPLIDNKESLLYHRPGQFVGRSIWKFKKEA